jgi:N-acetylmuramoyl-L-alanine amidase
VYKSLVKPPKPSHHTVVRGDSLSKIALNYGTSVAALKRINDLRSNTVMLGARLKIPGGNSRSAGTASKSQTSRLPTIHTVRRGESLSTISARYNVSINTLKSLNKMSANTVYIGQKLKLGNHSVSSGNETRYHTVRRGDTLSEIAEKYGATMTEIMRINSLRSRTVMLGQTLKIPGS